MLKKIAYAVVFCVLLLALHVGQVNANYPTLPLLKLMPEEIACHEYGESFGASVWLMEEGHSGVDGYWDISSFDIWVYFDPAFINAVKVKIDPDGWWTSFWPGGTFIVLNDTDNNAGTVRAVFLGLPSEEGFHQPPEGIGRLLSIDFVAIAANITLETGTKIYILSMWPTMLEGFPHPERHVPPWDNPLVPEVDIPFVVENSTFYFSPVGDVNFDGEVNIQDVIKMGSMYGCKEGESKWHTSSDLAPPYGVIDILDMVTCIGHYGEKYP